MWHTTGSGKTLTSFKAAQLASKLPSVDKVLFVVDRKDLDYQTMKEYDRFEKGAVNGTTNTAHLKRHLEDPASRIIVTTIQKLARFIAQNKAHEIYSRTPGRHLRRVPPQPVRRHARRDHQGVQELPPVRLHRHADLRRERRRGRQPATAHHRAGVRRQAAHLHDRRRDQRQERAAVPRRLHQHDQDPRAPDRQAGRGDRHRACAARSRSASAGRDAYILDHFDQKTRRNSTYRLGDKRVAGFNSMFATASIDAAKRYYAEFKKQQADARRPIRDTSRSRSASSTASPPTRTSRTGILGEEEFETGELDASSRDFLEAAIADYNAIFGTSFDTSADRFQNYYKDLSQRLKNRELDLVIVVNMFLTGFDATTLNTLWVDKNLRQHGLIQAYSRTNRILNSVKTYGNIVCFRDLEQATNDALALFGNQDATGIVLLKPYGDYYAEYQKLVADLLARFPLAGPSSARSTRRRSSRSSGRSCGCATS